MLCPGTSAPVCLSFSVFFSLLSTDFFLQTGSLTALFVTLSLFCLQTLCLHLLPLCHTLSSSHCPCVCLPVTHTSHQQPLAAGCL